MEAIGQTVEKFGIMDNMPRLYAMALGAGETTPLRHTAAYAMLDNGGKRITPTLIDRIQDRYGKTIFRADQRECDACGDAEWKKQPVPKVPDNARADRRPGARPSRWSRCWRASCSAAPAPRVKAVGKPIAGKTGTTNDWQDAWFVGFTPDLAAGVYVGYDDPVYLGSDETGGHLAAPIFRDFMTGRAEGRAGQGVPHPAGPADVPRQPGDRAAGRRPASRRSGRATSPAPNPARTATAACSRSATR